MTNKGQDETEREETTAEAPTEPGGEIEVLQKKLAEAEARAAEYLDGWQRAQAEFSNYKKRQDAERAQADQLASANFLRKLLPIVDDFDRALKTLPPDLQRLTWCEGVLLIKRKLDLLLESEGVRPIEVEGKTFDPLYHEAVTHEEAAGYEDGAIIGEVQRGYMLGDYILRPALVRVAKAPAESPVKE